MCRVGATTAECLISVSNVLITEDAAGGRGSFTAVDVTGMSTGSDYHCLCRRPDLPLPTPFRHTSGRASRGVF